MPKAPARASDPVVFKNPEDGSVKYDAPEPPPPPPVEDIVTDPLDAEVIVTLLPALK